MTIEPTDAEVEAAAEVLKFYKMPAGWQTAARLALLAAARARSAVPATEAVATVKRIEVDIGGAVKALQASPELAQMIGDLIHPVLPDTREGFERELHDGIVNRLVSLTVGTCSCDTKSPELKYHSEACRYRIASEALELARPFYAPATGEREPSRATDTAGENDGWKHDRPFITTNSGPDGKKFVSVLVRTMDALHDAHDLVINAFKAAGAK